MMTTHEAAPASRAVAVVTGSARGIGRAIASDLVARGFRVVVGDLDPQRTATTASELGPYAVPRRMDVADRDLLSEAILDIESTLGPIAVWVNNAGIMPTGGLLEHDLEMMDQVIDVNFRGVVHATALILPHMQARGTGTIVNIASATSIKALAGLAVYSATKHAVLGFSEALRRELRGSGVQVCVVMPYLAATAMGAGIQPQPGFKAVTPQQVSRAVMRALDSNRFHTYVPGYIGPIVNLGRLLPLALQDRLDDLLKTDRIGLCGAAHERAAYLADITKR